MMTAASLRPYQRRALAEAKAAIDAGNRRVVIVSCTGSGKTHTASAAVAARVAKGQRVAWMAHRVELVDQAVRSLRMWGLDVGTRGMNASAPVQVISMQGALAKGEVPPAELVVIDECVSADTIVGGKRADCVKVGDMVEAHDGEHVVTRKVTHVFRKKASSLRTIRVGKRAITVTDNHPVWTLRAGWTYAGSVEEGDVCLVWEGCAEERERSNSEILLRRMPYLSQAKPVHTSASLRSMRETVVEESMSKMGASLLCRVQREDSFGNHGSHQQSARFEAYEAQEPDASGRHTQTGVGLAQSNRSQAGDTGWQRARSDGASRDPLASPRRRLGDRAQSHHWQQDRVHRDAELHSRGHREPCADGVDRGGWWKSQLDSEASERQSSRRMAGLARVDSVEVHEQGSDGTFGGRAPDGFVYNFEVEGEHNFFANGILTHNCHHAAASTFRRLVEAYPDSDILGLTATPERGDGRPLDMFNALVVAAQSRQMVDAGVLTPCVTYRPSRIQPKGKLAQLPVDAYIAHRLVGKRCIVFASNVKEAEEFASQFRAKGLKAHVVHGAMPGEARVNALADLARGTVNIVVSVMVLTEGFDCPAVEVVIMARKCGSQSMLIQCVGRGLRASPGKTECHFFDLCGVTHILGDPLEDREFSLDGEGIKRKGVVNQMRLCRICGNEAPPPGERCPCGAAPSTIIATPTGDKLEKFARIRLDGESERAVRLAKWIREAITRKKPDGSPGKWQAALYRYKGAYGATATPTVISQALAIAHGRAWCTACKSSSCSCTKEKTA